MIDMAGMPPRCQLPFLTLTVPTSRLTPGQVPSLGERIGTALRRGQSLELYLRTNGEKVYNSKEEALSRVLQPPNSFIARWLSIKKGFFLFFLGVVKFCNLGFAIRAKREMWFWFSVAQWRHCSGAPGKRSREEPWVKQLSAKLPKQKVGLGGLRCWQSPGILKSSISCLVDARGGWQFTRDPRLQIPAMDLLSLVRKSSHKCKMLILCKTFGPCHGAN